MKLIAYNNIALPFTIIRTPKWLNGGL